MSELVKNHSHEAKAGGEEGITDHRTNIVRHDGFWIRSTNDVGDMNMISLKCSVGFVHRKEELEIGPYPHQGAAQDDLPESPKVWIVTDSYLAQV